MKKILFALLLLPLCSYAQLEIGANDGVAIFKPLEYSHDVKQTINTKNTFNAVISYNLHHFKLGVGYNEATLDFSNTDPYAFFSYQQHIHNIFLFSDYVNRIKRSSFYSGILVGYVTGGGTVNEFGFSSANGEYYSNEKKTGFSLGVHIGYAYDIYRGLGVNADLSAIYMATNGKIEGGNEFYYFPLTLGIHYRIPFHKKTPKETPATQVIKGM